MSERNCNGARRIGRSDLALLGFALVIGALYKLALRRHERPLSESESPITLVG